MHTRRRAALVFWMGLACLVLGLLWWLGTITFDPSKINWDITNSGLAAWATFAAAAVALWAALEASREAERQRDLQTLLEEVRLKQDYLNRALYIIYEGLRGAEIFVAAMDDFAAHEGELGRRASDEKAIRKAFERAYTHFDRTLRPTRDILKSMDEPSDLVEAINLLLLQMNGLYDVLMEHPRPSEDLLIELESRVIDLENGKHVGPFHVEEATKQASDKITLRIRELHDRYREQKSIA